VRTKGNFDNSRETMASSSLQPAIVYNALRDPPPSSDATTPFLKERARDEEFTEKQLDQLQALQHFKRLVLFRGIGLGFAKDWIVLGASVYLAKYWGNDGVVSDLLVEKLQYSLLWFVSKADLAVYAVTWLLFLFCMTKDGVEFAMVRLDRQSALPCTRRTRRFVFDLGARWLAGLIIGAFISGTVIEIAFGFPVAFVPFALINCFDVALCYIMALTYDYCTNIFESDEEVSDDNLC
jgi:hypothetical protein